MTISTDRLYKFLTDAKMIRGQYPQTEVARLLNISPQIVNNWEARGISKEGMLKCQRKLGVSATWLELGDGESKASEPAAAFDRVATLSNLELQLLDTFRKIQKPSARKQVIGYLEWMVEREQEFSTQKDQ